MVIKIHVRVACKDDPTQFPPDDLFPKVVAFEEGQVEKTYTLAGNITNV